jgi:PPP family 3-phenylpropionic acid transporter
VLLVWVYFMPVRELADKEPFWKNVRALLGNWAVLIFLLVALGGGIGLAMIHHYLFLFLNTLGASRFVMGTALTMATISELVVLYYSDRLLRRWGTRGLLVFALAVLSFRLVAYGLIHAPGWVLVIQLLHGPTFAALWVAGVAYIAEIAPPGLRNTSQGLLSGIVIGLGSTLGALIGGALYERVGFSQMYLFAGAGMLVLTVLFVVANRFQRRWGYPSPHR